MGVFEHRITLFKPFGFEVKIDLSWLALVALLTWSLAVSVFPGDVRGVPQWVYWVMGFFGAIGLFFSIVFHELSHSLVARRYDLPIRGITLFILGGVAEMESEPPSPKAEFLMAIAGPISSVVLGSLFFGASLLGDYFFVPSPITSVVSYLATMNWWLAIFNLLPAFPLDGGRVLRAALWSWRKNMAWATRIASFLGEWFGVLLVVWGGWMVIVNNRIGGLWMVMIGIFLRNAARMSYRQLVMRHTLEGDKIARFMRRDPVTVPPSATLEDFVENYVYRYHFKMFPVVEGDELHGCVTAKQVKNIPRETWQARTVRDIATPCSPKNTVGPDLDTMHALALMHRTGNSRFMVVENNRLVGIVTLKDMLKFLSLKFDLEGTKMNQGDRL